MAAISTGAVVTAIVCSDADLAGPEAASARPPERFGPQRLRAERPGWPAVRYVLMVYGLVKLGLTLIGVIGVGLLPRNTVADVPGWPASPAMPGWHNAFTAYERWDALWYLRIASQGYSDKDSSPAFFPLYPDVVRWVARPLGSHWLLAAYIVSNLALVGALLLLYMLTKAEFGDVFARRSVLYICVFPTALFLFAPYSESLFLLLSIACLLAARQGWWPIAGILAAGASGTRSVGLLLVLPMALEGIQQALGRAGLIQRGRALVLPAISTAIAPLGLVVYMLSWRHANGNALQPFSAQGGFGRKFRAPWVTVERGVDIGWHAMSSYPGGYHATEALLMMLALPAVGWGLLRLRPMYSSYALVSVVFMLLLPSDFRPLGSTPRYLLVVFPLVWALASAAARFRAHQAIVASSAAAMGIVSVLFVNWYWFF